jgi:hypothetical protein
MLFKTREQTGFFVIFFSLARDKTKTSDRIHWKYIIWAIYLHIRGGGKVYGQFEVGKQFFLGIW